MRDIFTKEFILKVLLPILATIILSALLYFIYSPFIVFLGIIVFSSLFFYSKYAYSYDKDFYEEYYEEEDEEDIQEDTSLLDKIKNVLPVKNKNVYDDINMYEDEYSNFEEESRPRKQVIEVQVNNQPRRSPELKKQISSAPTQKVNPSHVERARVNAGETRKYRPAVEAVKPQRVRVSKESAQNAQRRPQRPTTNRQNFSYTEQQRPVKRKLQRHNTEYDEDYEFEYYPYDD